MAGIALILGFLVRETHKNPKNYVRKSIKGAILPSAMILLCTVTYGSIVAFLPFFARDIPNYGFYYTSYALSSILIRIPIGRMSDRVGRGTIIIPGMVTLSVSLLLLSASNSLLLLICSGFLYGVGFNSVYPVLTALLVDRVPEEVRARSLSLFTASFDMGVAMGSFVFGLVPLLWIYPLGALVGLGGLLLFSMIEYVR
jgi:MFS family permease